MIKLFWCPRTRASRILWMLAEMGEPFEVEAVDLLKPETKSIEFLAASPMGKVPAIADGPVKIADSAAIALYLADRYPASALAPAIDDPLRGNYLVPVHKRAVLHTNSECSGIFYPLWLGFRVFFSQIDLDSHCNRQNLII